MSKNINVNPDHYKVAGRERPGEDVIHSEERRALARETREPRRQAPHIPNQERASRPRIAGKAASARRLTLKRRPAKTS
jgi:hypothetical protein